jgi:predicted RND superfamily exporter protein
MANHPWSVLALLVGLTALAGSQLFDLETGEVRLQLDSSFDRLLPKEGRDREIYEQFREVFGSDEKVIVALHSENVFTPENLARVKSISERIAKIKGVHRVVSLTTARHIVGRDGEFPRPEPFVSEIPDDPEELERIHREVMEDPVYAGTLASADGRTTGMIVQFLRLSDREYIDRELSDQIEAVAREEAGDAEISVSGGLHLKTAQLRYQLGDAARSFPIILVVLCLVLVLSFRTLRGVVVPLVTILVALSWTMGVAAWIGRPLNLITMLVPPLLLVLGLSYSVHVVSEYYDMLRDPTGRSSLEAAREALRLVWRPVALTAVTTAAGFAAMLLQGVEAVREFGVLSLIGVVFTGAASLTLAPALLAVTGRSSSRRSGPEKDTPDLPARLAAAAARFSLDNRRAILIATGVALALAVAAMTQLEVGANSIEAFPPDSQIRRDFNSVNDRLEGANSFYVFLRTEQEKGFAKLSNLQEIEAFQDWLEAQPEVGGTTSVVEYLKVFNRAFHAEDPAYLKLPDSDQGSEELLIWLGRNVNTYIDNPYRRTAVVVRANVYDTERVAALINRVEMRLAGLPEHIEATVTGNPVLTNALIDRIARGQVYSMLGALVLIYGVLIILFSDRLTALIALVPNVVPIAAYFAALAVSGITLNPTTSVIAPMALGIAVDDTIHYLTRFQDEAKRLANERRATVTALRSVGWPITITSISICTGFLVFTTSDLPNQVQLGALGAFTLAVAWLLEFTLTPAICAGLRVVTLWDTLTLDLGEDPQESIRAIFAGLSSRQCRIVALMVSLRTIPAGRRLMTTGEVGRDMYVVIDGRLRVWEERDGHELQREVSGRGDVLGEVTFFVPGRRRTANVDVFEDARLLRFTPSNLERLSRRYPRIASQVFRNLNEFQAERLAQR